MEGIFPAKVKNILAGLCFVSLVIPLDAQRELSGVAADKLALEKLNVTGSVLMIAAHPDDENTALLAYLARGRKLRTGYLSLTRGEGGQNLIGPQQGDALGVMRTQELLAARRIDGAEQYFTRAIDFGFSKTAAETFEKWGHEKILSDVVWVIRRFQPDVIILRFSGTPRDGHGQHQASAILGKEAFFAAADPARFPEQLKWVKPWQAKRLMWNVFSFTKEQEAEADKLPNKVEIDPGDYDPLLGHSFGEIAGQSRSMHRSQGMGAPERKGTQKNFLQTIAGEPAKRDPMEGIDLTWDSIPGSSEVSRLLAEANRTFDLEHPEKTVPLLLKAEPLLAALHQPVAERKHRELLDAIALCSGLWLEAIADHFAVVPGGTLKFTATGLNRAALPVTLESVSMDGIAHCPEAKASGKPLPPNTPEDVKLSVTVGKDQPYSQPYWLRYPKQGETYTVPDQLEIGLAENPPLFQAHFNLRLEGQELAYARPAVYRYIDRVQGELTRPIVVEPPVAVEMPTQAVVFPTASNRAVSVQVAANVASQSGVIRLEAPAGWKITPQSQEFHLADVGTEAVVPFEVTPPAGDAKGTLRASAKVDGQSITVGTEVISFPHIPTQTLFPPAAIGIARADILTLAKRVGYVMGAGDDEPEALRQIGIDVILLSPDDLTHGDLSRFDAVVTGVRAYNTRTDLRANQQRLLDYVSQGGTLVVQYNVLEGGFTAGDPTLLAHIGPYPIKVGRDRVTVEETPVAFPTSDSTLLREPNKITEKDFEGWVQERGLYFASEWDPRYKPLFEMHDPTEKPMLGGTLYTKYGKGAYVFSPLSWFRELPAGVPGAFRVFANLLSAGKTL
jgi:LmbE family N-acetylglucosaminyl deacetylase